MKKAISHLRLLLLSFALIFSFNLEAQPPTFTAIHNAQAIDWIAAVKYLGIPYGAVLNRNVTGRTSEPNFFYLTADSIGFYIWNGSNWIRQATAASAYVNPKSIAGVVGGGGGDDPTSNATSYVNTKLIGLGSRITIVIAGVTLLNYGPNPYFSFNNSTGTINISPNKWTAGSSLFINLNQ